MNNSIKIQNSKFKIIFLALIFCLLPKIADAGVIIRPILNSGLIGYWNFQEGTGSIAYDKSGRGNNGTTVNGTSWADGKIGKGLDFDGSNDHVYMSGNDYKYTGGDLTLSAWVYQDAEDADSSNIISKPWNGSGQYNYRLILGATDVLQVYLVGASSWSLTTTDTLPTGEWTHIAFTINGTSKAVEIYKNGTSIKSGTHTITNWTPSSGDSNLSLSIGTLYPYGAGWAGNTTYSFDGKIDDVRYYNRALSADEIKRLAISTQPKVTSANNTDLVAYFPFDEGKGTYVNDQSNNGYGGSIVDASGTPSWTQGKLGNALEFDGVNNGYVDIVNVGTMANFTLSAWVYNKSGGDSRHSLLGSYWEVVGTTICYWSYSFDNDYWRCSGSGTVPYETWTHITTTWDGSIIRHYINGAISWTDTATSGGTNQAFTVIAGTSTRKFYGKVDELRIYSRTLSATDVASLYGSGLIKIGASQANQLTDGLVNYWSFNGPDIDGTTGYDRGSQGNNLVMQAGAIRAGKVGQGTGSDSTSLYSTFPSTFSVFADNADWTLTGWMKIQSGETGSKLLINFVSGRTGVYYMGINDSKIVFTHYNGSGQNEYGTSTVSDGNWHFLAWVNYSNETIDLYVDGVLENDGANSSTSIDPVYNGFMGSSTNVNIDEVRVYNRSLSPAEITRLYNLGK